MEEKSRAEQFHVEPAKRAYIVCRAQMRQILGKELQQTAESLHFEYNADGKPCLSEYPDFGFNLSHSHAYAALACMPQHKLGVDIEKKRRQVDFKGIMKSYFNPAEQQYWQQEPTAERFFQLWTAKEALIKASGEGFRKFEDFTVTVDENNHLQLSEPSPWQLIPLVFHNDYAAHAAIDSLVPIKVDYQSWP